MSQKQYWKGLEELENSASHQETVANEFKEPLPLDISDSMLDATTPRRDFLKYLGFSTAAAMLAASCEMPVRKAIPYAIKPEDIVPGVPNFYASTFVDGGDYCAIIIKTRDGRPIKIEGNPKSSITKGGTSARVQASVLNLYDKMRLRHPATLNGGKDEKGIIKPTEVTFDALDRMVADEMAKLGGKPAVILTGSITSPTVKEAINQFIAAHPGSRHVTYDPISYSAMLLANEACYGKRALPVYHFEKATTIVSLDADFLGTWLSPVEYGQQYSEGRKVNRANMKMSRHYHVEGHHSLTGANADVRATCKPSQVGAVAVALYNALNGTAPSLGSAKLNDLVKKAAADLAASRGAGLVVCGQNDVNIQTVVNAINDKIGANGSTINWGVTNNTWQGVDADFMTLVNDMTNGNVGALLIHGVNPSYTFDAKKFNAALAKVPVTVSFNDRIDETTMNCKFAAPDHHFLESWGDAEPRTGYYSLMQPGIAPIFKTRSFGDTLLKWSGATQTYGDLWKNYWATKLGSQENFDHALQDGVIEPAAETWAGAGFAGNVGGAVAAIGAIKGGAKELVVYQKVSIGHGGAWSNNPWLQEMPDPITKATWDNYICVSPATAKALHNELTGISEVENNKRVCTVTVAGKEPMSLPIVVVPGMHNDVIAIAVGYGRDMNIGRAAANTGKNAYALVGWSNNSFQYNTAADIKETAEFYPVSITQTHHSYEDRKAIVREYTLEEFKKDPDALIKSRFEEIGHFTQDPWEHHEGEPTAAEMSEKMDDGFNEKGTLYGKYDHPGIHWGMSIDLTACIGCGACVIACQAENNVSVVGKEHVGKSHEMHWLHIDRYFSGNPNDADSIQTVFQPMLCQHCDNAPCENVCPVSATNHSSEGINQMAYNRCIGTKYCANNCPYKVRHFNWMDWNKADCFDDNTFEDGRRDDINDDLTRMVLNPDVTVRSRGVMEKCTFCVQRLQDAKLTAKKEGRPVKDGEAVTACQQACASGCIKFGNMNDKESDIYKTRRVNDKERVFYSLEQIHTLPNVSYLSKIRNADEVISGKAADIMSKESI